MIIAYSFGDIVLNLPYFMCMQKQSLFQALTSHDLQKLDKCRWERTQQISFTVNEKMPVWSAFQKP